MIGFRWIALPLAVAALVVTGSVHAQTSLVRHLPGHGWAVRGGKPLAKLPLKQRLRAYQTIAAHGHWFYEHRYMGVVNKQSVALIPVFDRHLRMYRHALAHIKKIKAALHPVFGVPPVGFRYPWWWVRLGRCETGSDPPDPAYNGPDGFDGWINFLPSTWDTYKVRVPGASRYAYAYQAPEYVQYLVTMAMHADVSWSQSNPACSRQIGLG